MTKSTIITIVICIALLAGFYLLGFKHGRLKSTNDQLQEQLNTKTEYSTGTSFSNTFTDFKPIKVELPSIPYILTFKDTLYIDSIRYVVREVDSLAILKDWLSKRHYEVTIFDIDTIGKCDITAETQYNQLKVLGYNYTPRTRIDVRDLTPKLELFGGVGINTGNYYNFQAGVFKGNLGASYQFNREFNSNNNYHGINVMYKFKLK